MPARWRPSRPAVASEAPGSRWSRPTVARGRARRDPEALRGSRRTGGARRAMRARSASGPPADERGDRGDEEGGGEDDEDRDRSVDDESVEARRREPREHPLRVLQDRVGDERRRREPRPEAADERAYTGPPAGLACVERWRPARAERRSSCREAAAVKDGHGDQDERDEREPGRVVAAGGHRVGIGGRAAGRRQVRRLVRGQRRQPDERGRGGDGVRAADRAESRGQPGRSALAF